METAVEEQSHWNLIDAHEKQSVYPLTFTFSAQEQNLECLVVQWSFVLLPFKR